MSDREEITIAEAMGEALCASVLANVALGALITNGVMSKEAIVEVIDATLLDLEKRSGTAVVTRTTLDSARLSLSAAIDALKRY